MSEEILDIVNENDIVTATATRKQVYADRLWHRIVHVLLFNEKDEMLLQLRSKNVSFCPNHWSTAVGSHVQSGESYDQAAMREFEEELGRSGKIDFLDRYFYTTQDGTKKFLAVYTSKDYEGVQAGEDVEKIGFFIMRDIKRMIDSGEKFHPELLFLLKEHFID